MSKTHLLDSPVARTPEEVALPAVFSAGQGSGQDNKRERIQDILAKKGGRYGFVSYIKMAYSRSRMEYILFLQSQKVLSMGQYLTLERYLRGELKEYPSNLRIVVRQPGEALMEDAVLLEKTVQEYMIACEPSLIPFVSESSVRREDSFLYLDFRRELAPELVRRLEVPKRIEGYLSECYGLELKIKELSCAMVERVNGEDHSLLFNTHLRKEKDANLFPAPSSVKREAGSAPVQKAPSASAPQRSAKRSRKWLTSAIQEPPAPMSALLHDSEAVVEGEVIQSEVKLLKEGKYTVLLFNLTDFTSSVQCKKFFRGDNSQEAGEIKTGQRYRVRGNYTFDSYAKSYILSVVEMAPVEKKDVMDNSPDKRVELHLHTNMSAMDGITSASDYIARAAKWGHKAIAITDHGVVQAFPEAAGAAKKCGVKVIYGMEAYMVDDSKRVYEGREDHSFEDELVVFDIETTGLRVANSEIIEIGAVRIRGGEILEKFHSFLNPNTHIPPEITKLTGITDDMVRDAPQKEEVLPRFHQFAGGSCLVAHNASFDTGFVFGKSAALGIEFTNDVLDTLQLARAHLTSLKSHKLNRLASHYGITFRHHRAIDDAETTAKILFKMFEEIAQKGTDTLRGLNFISDEQALSRNMRPFHTILLCKNKTGLINLYRLVSFGHIRFFRGRPRIPKSYINQYREGLLVGSACEQGEIYQAILESAPEKKLRSLASFYDYLEIQPHGNNQFMIRQGTVADKEELSSINRRIYQLGKSLGKPTVATSDAHFLAPKDEYYRRIVMDSLGFEDADNQPPLYFKTTDEMLEEFSYLGESVAREVVIDNPVAISDMTEEIELFPGETVMPSVKDCEKDVMEWAYRRMHALYGDPLPELIAQRLERELGSIIKHGFSILYWIAMKLVKQSMNDGYLVGSRGSVGSSLAAYATGITEVNPLPPHYRCPGCRHSDFDVDREKYGCGADMPESVCPVCHTKYEADGYDIPFEVFLGLNAEKVPDIDLNFSGEYQARAHKYIEELFGEEFVFRAGTISAIQFNTAIGMVRKYLEKREMTANNAEIERLAGGICGIKKTTSQHPGGLVIVPRDREVYEFTPIQKPADKMDRETITTHFDFNSMHDILVKLDILGHDNPTIIRMLQDLTGLDPLHIPLDDPDTLSLFSSTQALGINPEQIRGIQVGTLGIPEFGTKFVRQMLYDTRPTTLSELVRISGLSHGTDVWKDNAEALIQSGVTTLSGAICTRDDIMNYLAAKGVDKQLAFFTMESVRKGKGLTEQMEQAMVNNNVPGWFIDSCKKIKYMFPKAHAVAYVVMSLRIAYCKVHHPREYYAAFFTIKAGDFDASYVMEGPAKVKQTIEQLEAIGPRMSNTEKDLLAVLELVMEMFERGIGFLPVDLKKSRAKKFVVEGDRIRLPFISIPKLGEKAAEALEYEAAREEFFSVEELKRRYKISQAVVDMMGEMGCLGGLPAKAQLSMFDMVGQNTVGFY